MMLNQLARHYTGVMLDQGAHASMSSLDGGCSVCHHHSGQEIPACRSCHGDGPNPANLSQPGLRGAYHRQCMGCHRDWTHATACDACHDAAGADVVPAVLSEDATDLVGQGHPPLKTSDTYVYETPETGETRVTFHHSDHTDVFGLTCAQCHQGESCGSCHDIGGARERTPTEPHESCVDCHAATIESDCAFCHGETARPRFDHATRNGFALSTWHPDVSCTACHVAPGKFSGLTGDCLQCHEAGLEPATFAHERTGTPLDEAHREIDCVGCHVEGMSVKPRCDACHDEMEGPKNEDNPAVAGE